MGIVGFSLKRRVTISMCAVAVMLFGIVAFTRLPINLLPDLSYPSLTVETRLPGAAPARLGSIWQPTSVSNESEFRLAVKSSPSATSSGSSLLKRWS